MASMSEEDMETCVQGVVTDVLSDSTNDETLQELCPSVDGDTEKPSQESMTVDPIDQSQINAMQSDPISSVSSGSLGKESKVKFEDELAAKELQLQSARQMWAIFDAMGPNKAPKKCERPFVGRQQEMYEEWLKLGTENHKKELKIASQRKELDKKQSAMEAMFISKGLSKTEDIPIGPLSIMRSWFIQLIAFKTTRDAFLKKKVGILTEEDLFSLNDLCSAADYVFGESTEALSFSTRRNGIDYDICITINMDTLDLKVERKEPVPNVHISADGMIDCVKKAMKQKFVAQNLVRCCFWKYIDKVEEEIRHFLDENDGE